MGVRIRRLDEVVAGQQVLAVGPHRAVLPAGSRFLRPVLACSACGRDHLGHEWWVLTEAWLERAAGCRLCERCAAERVDAPEVRAVAARPAQPVHPRRRYAPVLEGAAVRRCRRRGDDPAPPVSS
jgi:hypothetical protein